MKQPWTGKELAYLQASYGTASPEEIAHHLHRSTASVVSQAHRRRLNPHHEPAKLLRLIRRYYRRGWSDRAIARELAIHRTTVLRVRAQLGFPRQPDNPAARKHYARQRNIRARAAEYPRWVNYLASRRRLRYLILRPHCTTFSQVIVFNLITARGPMRTGVIVRALACLLCRNATRKAIRQLAGYKVLRRSADGLWTLVKK